DQHGHIVIDADQYGAGGLAGNAARFERYGRLTELEFLGNRIHGVFLLCVALGEIGWNAGSRTRSFQYRKRKAGSGELQAGQLTHFQLPTPSFQPSSSRTS